MIGDNTNHWKLFPLYLALSNNTTCILFVFFCHFFFAYFFRFLQKEFTIHLFY